MSTLTQEMNERARKAGVPLGVQFDLTYRCNERCVHCYLDHHDDGELTTAEILDILQQLAAAGTFFLCFSGGEVQMRSDFFRILEYARSSLFSVTIKTNALMIREQGADYLAKLGVQAVQVSVYSDRPEVHDAITQLPGSLRGTLAGIRLLRARGVKTIINNVLMRANLQDVCGVIALAKELGAEYRFDPSVTPKLDGDRSVLNYGLSHAELREVFRTPELVGDVNEFCSPGSVADDSVLNGLPCSAGHTYCYISPYGEVYPCVQFPLPAGNLRRQRFVEIWKHSPQMQEVRSLRVRDLPDCSSCLHVATCGRCPGLAYMDGDMRGPSGQDCDKSVARTGQPAPHLLADAATPSSPSTNPRLIPTSSLRSHLDLASQSAK
jgi:radical SAM protein with 4Fe4S-binding SPASM domain